MSLSHHGDAEELEAMRRFTQQIDGTARRAYPQGRMGAEDDGELAFALAADHRHQTVVIRFGKPVEWVGLGLEDARKLSRMLVEKIIELRTAEPSTP